MTDVASPRRSFWAWCLESEEPTKQQRDELGIKALRARGHRDRGQDRPEARRRRRSGRLASRSPTRSGLGAPLTRGARVPLHGAHFTDRTRAFHLEFPNPPDVVAHPSTEAELEATSTGAAQQRLRGRAVRGRLLGRVGCQPARGRRRRHDRPRPPRPGARGRRRVAGRRASRRACSARTSRTSSARAATRCATSRSRSGSRRSGGGSRRAPAATTPRTTRTSTTSSSRCGCSLLAGGGSRRRLPGSGAGPSPDRMVIGSEGILGIISEAWMRIQRRPDVPRHGRGHVRLVGGRRPRQCARSCRRSCGPRTAASSIRPRRTGPQGSTARRRS